MRRHSGQAPRTTAVAASARSSPGTASGRAAGEAEQVPANSAEQRVPEQTWALAGLSDDGDQAQGHLPDDFVLESGSGSPGDDGSQAGEDEGVESDENDQSQSGQDQDMFPEFGQGLPADLVRVEEDWELEVSGPAPEIAAPQLGTVMTPFGHAGGFYVAFLVNHRMNPHFAAGGMELQLWLQGQQLGWLNAGQEVLSKDGEKITWTQCLYIDKDSGKLVFEVSNGQSATWGGFGTVKPLRVAVRTTLTNLNDYDPSVSVANSGATFAANRVKRLVLKAVRGYSDSGELAVEHAAPAVVLSH